MARNLFVSNLISFGGVQFGVSNISGFKSMVNSLKCAVSRIANYGDHLLIFNLS